MIDLTGRVVNKLRVIRRVDNVGKQPAWLCVCECGAEKRVLGMRLRAASVVDCGCGYIQRQSDSHRVHGMTDTPEWVTWKSMLSRCTVPTNRQWPNYGGRGITVCRRWLTFVNFYADMGPRPDGTSLDRIDNNKGYSPSNCRWATGHEQQNNRRSNVYLTLDGQTKTMRQWAAHFGVAYTVVKSRHAAGKSGLDLFSASPRKSYNRLVTIDGDSKTIAQWAHYYGIPYLEMWKRLRG